MQIRLLYFHRSREMAGRASETVRLSRGAVAADALAWAVEQHPRLGDLRSALRIAVNEEYAAEDQRLRDGDTVAFLPPLSGG